MLQSTVSQESLVGWVSSSREALGVAEAEGETSMSSPSLVLAVVLASLSGRSYRGFRGRLFRKILERSWVAIALAGYHSGCELEETLVSIPRPTESVSG